MRNIFPITLVLVLLYGAASAAGAADKAEELGFNLFTDLAPLLALFGEQFARQFMSESLLWLDHIVFAMVPLGILTAIVGAIRVSGPSWARAFIGRARESRAAAEIQLMSSTSNEVCEVYNGKAIVRSMGQPMITQLILFPGSYKDGDHTCGLHTLETAYNSKPPLLEMGQFGIKTHWHSQTSENEARTKRVTHYTGINGYYGLRRRKRTGRQGHADLESEGASSAALKDEQPRFPDALKHSAPNLQLNLPATVPDYAKTIQELWYAGIAAVIIQIIVIVIGAITSYYSLVQEKIQGESRKYGFPLFVSGTVCLNAGMMICSWVIEKGTKEYLWRKPRNLTSLKSGATGGKAQSVDMATALPKGGKQQRVPKGSNQTQVSIRAEKIDNTDTSNELDAGLNFHLFWLQRKHTVNDQAFDSYLILGGIKSEILTSNPSEYSDWQTSRSRGLTIFAANKYELLAICGACLSVVGFILQFEGLRGLTWPTAVAQIGSIILMALIRAFVRRRLGDRPSTLRPAEGYELDWLAQRLVYENHPLQHLSNSDVSESPQSEIKWKVMTQPDRPATRLLAKKGRMLSSGKLMNDERSVASQRVLRDTEAEDRISQEQNSTRDEYHKRLFPQNSRMVLKIRQRLGHLIRAPGVASKEAVALSRAITLVLNEIRPIQMGDHKTFEWYLDTKTEVKRSESHNADKHICNEYSDLITLQADGDYESGWRVSSPDIDAILSLWMASFVDQGPETRTRKDNTSLDWLMKKERGLVKYRRILGENPPLTSQPTRNESGAGSGNQLSSESGSYVESRSIDENGSSGASGSEIDVQSDTENQPGSGSRPDNQTPPNSNNNSDESIAGLYRTNTLTRDLNLWINDLPVVDSLNGERSDGIRHNKRKKQSSEEQLSKNFGLVAGFNGIKGSKEGSNVVFIDSSASLATALSHHMFSAFMWAVSTFIDADFFAQTTVEEIERSYTSDTKQSWTFPTLRNARMMQIVHGIEAAGLGTARDILLGIIPPLSYRRLLPNEVMLRPLIKEARDFELRHSWRQATDIYQKLLALEIDPRSRDRIAFELVVEVIEFLFFAKEVIDDRNGLKTPEEGKLNISAQSLATGVESIRTMLEEHPLFLSVVKKLQWFYFQQRRHRNFNTLFPKLEVKVEDTNVTAYFVNQIPEPTRKMLDLARFSRYHQGSSTSMKQQDWQLLQKEPELFFDLTDIFGWTPLHYAAAGCFSSTKDETEIADKLCKLWPPHHELRDKSGRTPLHYAAIHMPVLLEKLMEKNIVGSSAVMTPGRDGTLPIHSAARHGNLKAVKLLERFLPEEGDTADSFGRSILHLGAIGGHGEIIDRFVSKRKGALPSTDALSKRTPLHLALVHDCNEVAEKLLIRDLKLEVLMAADSEGITPIDLIMDKKQLSFLVSLFTNFPQAVWKKGLHQKLENLPNQPAKCFLALLEAAIRLRRQDEIRLLFRTVVDKSWDEDLITEAFSTAHNTKRFDLLPFLLEVVDNIAAETVESDTGFIEGKDNSVSVVNEKSRVSISELDEQNPSASLSNDYLEKSARVTAPDSHDGRATFATMPSTLSTRVRLHIATHFGAALMSWVIQNGRDDFIDLIAELREGDLMAKESATVDWNKKDSDGYSPLSWLAKVERADEVLTSEKRQRLLDCLWRPWSSEQRKKALNEPQGSTKMTPLLYAAKNGLDSLVQSFVEAGADIRQIDSFGESAFYHALKEHHETVCNILVQYDPDIVNAATGTGDSKRTPLFHAIVHEQEDVVQLLSKYERVNPNIADSDGTTPLSWCTIRGKTEMVNLLLQKFSSIDPDKQQRKDPLSYVDLDNNTGFILNIRFILKQTFDIYDSCRKAPEEIQLASDHIYCIAIVLSGVQSDLITNQRSFVYQTNDIAVAKKGILKSHLSLCSRALTRMQMLLNKFHSFKRVVLWDRFRWSLEGKKEIAECKADLCMAMIMLDMFMSSLGLSVLWKVEVMMEAFRRKADALEILLSPKPANSTRPRRAAAIGIGLILAAIGKFQKSLKRHRTTRLNHSKTSKTRQKRPTPVTRVNAGFGVGKKHNALLQNYANSIASAVDSSTRVQQLQSRSPFPTTSHRPLMRRSSSLERLVGRANAQITNPKLLTEHLECWKVGVESLVRRLKIAPQYVPYQRGQVQLKKMAAVFREVSMFDRRDLNEQDRRVKSIIQKKNNQEKNNGTRRRWFLVVGRVIARDAGRREVAAPEKAIVILVRRG